MNKLLKIYSLLLKEYGKQHWWPVTSNQPEFEIIIGAILTQNTSWKNVEIAISNLRKNNLIRVEEIKGINKNKLAALIKPSGYYNQKAERLKIFAEYITANYNGNLNKFLIKDTAKLRKELLTIKGIGPETADSIILYAAKKPVFVVDAYTKRIFTRLGMINKKSSYEEIQSFFQERLKNNVNLFNEYHALLVKHAKQYCRTRPLCSGCPLKGDCEYGKHHYS